MPFGEMLLDDLSWRLQNILGHKFQLLHLLQKIWHQVISQNENQLWQPKRPSWWWSFVKDAVPSGGTILALVSQTTHLFPCFAPQMTRLGFISPTTLCCGWDSNLLEQSCTLNKGPFLYYQLATSEYYMGSINIINPLLSTALSSSPVD